MTQVNVDLSLSGEQRVSRGLSNVGSAVGGLSGKVGVLAAVAGAGVFASLIKGSIDAGDEIQKLSLRIPVSTEALSQYRHVADLSGVSFGKLTKSWEKQTKSIAEAAQGTGLAKDAFITLGLSAEKLGKLRTDEQFEAIAEQLSKMEAGTERSALAMDIWGGSGAAMLQIADGGAKSIQGMRKEADQLGKTLSKTAANDMAASNDAIARMSASFSSLVQVIAVNVAPVITFVIDHMLTGFDKVGEFTSAVFGGIKDVAIFTFQSMIEGIGVLFEKLSGLPAALGGDKFREYSDTLKNTSESMEELRESYVSAKPEIEEFSFKIVDVTALSLTAAESQAALAAANKKTEKAANDAANAIKKESDELEKATEAAEKAAIAEQKAIETKERMLAAQLASLGLTNEYTSSLKNNKVAVLEVNESVDGLMETYLDTPKTVEEMVNATSSGFNVIKTAASEASLSVESAWIGAFQNAFTSGKPKEAARELFSNVKNIILSKIGEVLASSIWNSVFNPNAGSIFNNVQGSIGRAWGAVQNFFGRVNSGAAAATRAVQNVPQYGSPGSVPGGGRSSASGGAPPGALRTGAGQAAAGAAAGAAASSITRSIAGSDSAGARAGAVVAGAGAGFIAGGPLGAVAGAIVAAVTGGKSIKQKRAEFQDLLTNPSRRREAQSRANELRNRYENAYIKPAQASLTVAKMRKQYPRIDSWANVWRDPKKTFIFGNRAATKEFVRLQDLANKSFRNTALGKNQKRALESTISQFSARGFATGGEFVVSKPTAIIVGDQGPELVKATPMSNINNAKKALNKTPGYNQSAQQMQANRGYAEGNQYVFNGPVILDDVTMQRFQSGVFDFVDNEGGRF